MRFKYLLTIFLFVSCTIQPTRKFEISINSIQDETFGTRYKSCIVKDNKEANVSILFDKQAPTELIFDITRNEEELRLTTDEILVLLSSTLDSIAVVDYIKRISIPTRALGDDAILISQSYEKERNFEKACNENKFFKGIKSILTKKQLTIQNFDYEEVYYMGTNELMKYWSHCSDNTSNAPSVLDATITLDVQSYKKQ